MSRTTPVDFDVDASAMMPRTCASVFSAMGLAGVWPRAEFGQRQLVAIRRRVVHKRRVRQ